MQGRACPLRRVQMKDATDADEISDYGRGCFWAAVGMVALVVAAVLIVAYFADHWATLVAYMT